MIDVILHYLAKIDSSLLIIITTSLAGSYGKDYLRIMKSRKPEKVSLSNVLLSTVTATLVIYVFSDILVAKFGERILPFTSFVCGLIGFQLMQKLSTLTGIIELYNKISQTIIMSITVIIVKVPFDNRLKSILTRQKSNIKK